MAIWACVSASVCVQPAVICPGCKGWICERQPCPGSCRQSKFLWTIPSGIAFFIMWLYAMAVHQTCLTISGSIGLLNRTQTHLDQLAPLAEYLAVAALCNIWNRHLWRSHFCCYFLRLVFVFFTLSLLLFELSILLWAFMFWMTSRIMWLHTVAMEKFRVACSCSVGFRHRASARRDPLVDWKLFLALTAAWGFQN